MTPPRITVHDLRFLRDRIDRERPHMRASDYERAVDVLARAEENLPAQAVLASMEVAG